MAARKLSCTMALVVIETQRDYSRDWIVKRLDPRFHFRQPRYHNLTVNPTRPLDYRWFKGNFNQNNPSPYPPDQTKKPSESLNQSNADKGGPPRFPTCSYYRWVFCGVGENDKTQVSCFLFFQLRLRPGIARATPKNRKNRPRSDLDSTLHTYRRLWTKPPRTDHGRTWAPPFISTTGCGQHPQEPTTVGRGTPPHRHLDQVSHPRYRQHVTIRWSERSSK